MTHGNTPPYAGPPGPYPGPPPGWGGWLPPRPGVIPLAPLGFGDILGGAFSTIGRHWKQLLAMALAAYGMALVVVGAVIGVAYLALSDRLDRMLDSDTAPGWDDVWPLVVGFGAVYLIGMFVMLVANALIYASCPAVLQDAVLGRPSTFGVIWRRSVRRMWSVLGTVLLTALIVAVPVALTAVAFFSVFLSLMVFSLGEDGGGYGWLSLIGVLGMLATAPLAVWLWVKFSLAPAAAVFEGQGTIAAMTRSSRLVQGAWWRIFGISLLATLMAGVAGFIIQMPFSFANVFAPGLTQDLSSSGAAVTAVIVIMVFSLLSSLIGRILTAAFPQLVVSLLYVDQRIRRENLAPALAQAASEPPAAG